MGDPSSFSVTCSMPIGAAFRDGKAIYVPDNEMEGKRPGVSVEGIVGCNYCRVSGVPLLRIDVDCNECDCMMSVRFCRLCLEGFLKRLPGEEAPTSDSKSSVDRAAPLGMTVIPPGGQVPVNPVNLGPDFVYGGTLKTGVEVVNVEKR